ncbi:MAG: IS1380 family transposase [Epsilonproteobacteria bacterium]|nr:IS1380 family transposase [Campylobacterota bacterium]
MTQTILDFDLATTSEKLTPRAGTIILGEYIKGLGLEKLCNSNLPLPLNHKGYNPFDFIYPLVLMLHSGGRVIDDIREIKIDSALKQSLNIKNIPTASGIIKWLKRTGLAGVYGLEKINKTLLKRYLKSIDEDLILDIDATVIEAHKLTSKYTYKMIPGYTPMIGHINGGYVITSEFRDGNIAPADTNLEFVKKCINQLPKNKKLSWLRADSATYQAEVFNYCDENNINFAIGGQLDKSVIKQINKLSSWDSLSKFEDVSEFVHTMTKTNKAFRVIVIKRNITPILPNLEDILTDEEKAQYHKERYYVIATNNNELSKQEIIKLYRQRGETSENKIKELKNGFNMDYLPSGDFISNALYFQIGTLAYNLFILFKTILDSSLKKHTVKTIRYKLYNIAGKLISHARKTVLKVNVEFMGILQRIRQKAYEVSLE